MIPFYRENQLVRTQKNKSLKGELMIWRTKMQAKVQDKVQLAPNESKLVPRNLDPRPPPL